MLKMENPPIILGDVKVRDLKPDTRFIAVEIELDVETPSHLNLISTRVKVAGKLEGTLNYLYQEGFVHEPISLPQWNIVVFAGVKPNT